MIKRVKLIKLTLLIILSLLAINSFFDLPNFYTKLGNYMAAFGMSTSVLPNPDNTLHQELIKKEKELEAKDAQLQEREAKINNSLLNTEKDESFVKMWIIILVCLLTINLFLGEKPQYS